MSVGKEINNYMNDKGIKQNFLVKNAGIRQSKLSMLLNEKREFSLKDYVLICSALDVSVDKFIHK